MKKYFKKIAGAFMCVVFVGSNFSYSAFSQELASNAENISVLSEISQDIKDELSRCGVIAEDPSKVTSVPSVENENINISSVKTYGKNYVVVTFDGQLKNVDMSDVTLKKYSNNWYSLKPSLSNINVSSSFSTINDKGETVFVYEIKDTIDGIRVVPDVTGNNFDDLQAEITKADNYLSWQMDHGGWDKGVDKQASTAWNGTDAKNKFSGWTGKNGEPLGTIDNDATYTQMRQIAAVYREVKDEKYKKSIEKGLEFIFNLQYESGGLAQVYPRRGTYSDMVTFNDNAMINTLIMLEDMSNKAYPFDSDIISEEYMDKINNSLDKATDYILKSQIVSQGKLTAWCAQHDPVTYEPTGGRAYELASISGSESIPVIKFLMNRKNQTAEIKNAVECAIQWCKDSEVKGIKFVKNDPNGVYFVEDANSSLWYRFYEIDSNLPIFCDRDGIAKHNITEIGEERRNGYSWSGSWPRTLINVYDSVGYYPNRIEVVIDNTNSVSEDGKKLNKGQQISASEVINPEETVQDFVINKSSNTISKYNGNDKKITIPKIINNVAINAIAENAFENASNLKEIFIPDNIKNISDTAFGSKKDFTIFCNLNSSASEFANKNNIKYSILGDANDDKKIDATDAAITLNYVRNLDNTSNLGEFSIQMFEYIIDGNRITATTAAKILAKARNSEFKLF